MANSVDGVMVGKPLATGGALAAPRGTVLPTDPLKKLSGLYVPVGYLTDSGVVKSEKRNSGLVSAWGGDTIAITRKGYEVQIKVGLAEYLNPVPKRLVYGDANVQVLAPITGLAAPVVTLGATAGTGGTFTAGTKYWKVTALNVNGETIGSNEVSATLTTTSTQVLNWTAIPGSTGFNVYRGIVPGAEDTLVATLGVVATYTDTGVAGTPASSVPVVDSTGRGTQVLTLGTSGPAPRNAWVYEMFSDTLKKTRLIFPDLGLMDIEDVTYKDDDITALTATFQALPDAAGRYFYEYTDNGVRA